MAEMFFSKLALFIKKNSSSETQLDIYEEIRYKCCNEIYKKCNDQMPTCYICLDNIELDKDCNNNLYYLVSTECNHNFHNKCMFNLIKSKYEGGYEEINCPLCRKRILFITIYKQEYTKENKISTEQFYTKAISPSKYLLPCDYEILSIENFYSINKDKPTYIESDDITKLNEESEALRNQLMREQEEKKETLQRHIDLAREHTYLEWNTHLERLPDYETNFQVSWTEQYQTYISRDPNFVPRVMREERDFMQENAGMIIELLRNFDDGMREFRRNILRRSRYNINRILMRRINFDNIVEERNIQAPIQQSQPEQPLPSQEILNSSPYIQQNQELERTEELHSDNEGADNEVKTQEPSNEAKMQEPNNEAKTQEAKSQEANEEPNEEANEEHNEEPNEEADEEPNEEANEEIPLTQPIERGIRRRLEQINSELFGERLIIIEYEVNYSSPNDNPSTPVDQMIPQPDQPPRIIRRRLE